MTDAELEKAIQAIMKRLGAVNALYIKKIAAQIKKIGELIPSSVNRLVAMSEMNADLGEITEHLRIATAVNNREIQRIYRKALEDEIADPLFRAYLAHDPDAVRPEAKKRMTNFVKAVYRKTAGNLVNLSNTTAISNRQAYVNAIDRSILATATGVGSYTETMRSTIREIGSAGMQVVYESGYHRRLDTAVRQNIVDGVNQIAKTSSVMMGEAINEKTGEDTYDAIEISAHARSAPDHEPVQGRVFLKAEYEKMQAGLPFQDIDGRKYDGFRRPIGEWNCRHTPMSFSTKWSSRKWTNEQLQAFIDENKAGCKIGNKQYTLYEVSQIMRRIETDIRREKDTAVAAQAAGDNQLRVDCQLRINHLSGLYKQVTDASGLTPRRERMTVDGFRRAKVPENAEKGLTSGEKNGMIKSEKMALPKNEEKIKWLPKGKEISAETRRELTEYAAERGMVLKGLRRSDVDPELIKEMIDTAEEMLRKYPELNSNPNLPFTLKVVNGMDANDFAMTTRYQDINVVQLNANAFRDKNKLEEEYDKLVKERWFAQGTSYRSIIVHEIGHMYQRRRQLSDEDIVNIAMRVSGISDKKALFRYIESDLSRYASRYKEGTEILSEVFSSFYSGNSQSTLASGMMSQREMR